MPDGTTDYFFTDEPKVKLAGSFFDPAGVAGYSDTNGISWHCNYYSDLTPKSQNVTLKSVRLIPASDDVSEITLPLSSIDMSLEDDMFYFDDSDPTLYLDYTTRWTLELTMNYSDGDIDWTTTKTTSVVFLN